MTKFNFDEVTSREGTCSIQYDATELIFGKKDLAPFWIADMDIKTPEAIREALKKRIDNGIFGYTLWQTDCFYEPIKKWWSERHNVELHNDDIQYATSVLFAVAAVLKSKTEPGDAVMLTVPTYNSFVGLLEENDLKRVECELDLKDGQYSLDIDVFRKTIEDNDVKVYIHCNPHNPTGLIWTKEQQDEMMQICEENNVYFISDEIHKDFVRPKELFYSVANLINKYEKSIVITGLGKSFNLASLPFAYTVSKDYEIQESITKLMEQLHCGTVSSLALIALETAYNECGEWMDALNDYIHDNLVYVKSYIDENLSEYMSLEVPKATYLAWIDFSKSGFVGEEVQRALIDVGGLAISPGDLYLDPGHTHVRFNVGFRRELIEDAMKRIEKSFKYLEAYN
ncbi:MalY/PatB family protein [Phocicoccus pinnipedialis]|uniref:cysteine-S-conjugate beta-lyase n=1 Tax=Phocicoccus pinnipedialis TaxID=110845 RepID=A0A6V7RCI9_9BACL|nr:aminotransferase class I/II-fold pyridoxal phosphate-dependent enzyme [Jeotgalicoccus pinnipedialis]MBP1939551.1 cystathionine beta-lyase [Jeotgalicoccus pinnipedialis]CAD2074969.1 Cystathionine beta-lyase PatB [Jeotgalicoccus pinnipedialis]